MLFVNLSRRQVASYSYACIKLQKILHKMSRARKMLEDVAQSSFDKSFAKCVYLFTSESLQFENEIHAQINSFNCTQLNLKTEEKQEKFDAPLPTKSMELICNYLEENYIKSYKQLLRDKHLSSSLKSLINNQLQVFLASLTQLRLFNEVEASVN
jgi:hypothetical protein